MPNVGSVLRDEITRLSRREIRKQTGPTRKATTQHRQHIAALKKVVAQLERHVALLMRQLARQQVGTAALGDGSSSTKNRFVAKGLRSHRSRLGLSANDFGRLVGVSANSVYAWEQGKSAPRKEQLAKIAALRGVGKREAAKRLEMIRRAPHGSRRRG
jgi:DNA-binding transcriptional regulator YiaG